MSIKQLRIETGLTQREFAEIYDIPLQTLKQWESDPNSKSYRMPPDYVVSMITRLVALDYGIGITAKNRVQRLIEAAEETRTNALHWMRYLRKEFNGERSLLTTSQIKMLCRSDKLSMFQKVSLSRAFDNGSATNDFVVGLNMKTETPMIAELMRKTKNV